MAETTIVLTDDLRDLIRTARHNVGLSQRQAAKAARISEAWWQRVEKGTTPHAEAGTVAQMCYAIDVSPEQLVGIGQQHLAALVAKWRNLLHPVTDITEAALQELPGATDAERLALIAYLRTMRAVPFTYRAVTSIHARI